MALTKYRNRCLKLFVQRRIHKRRPPSSKTKGKKNYIFSNNTTIHKSDTRIYNSADVGRRASVCMTRMSLVFHSAILHVNYSLQSNYLCWPCG